MITASHAAVGVSTASITAALTTLLTNFHGLDADHASAAAFLIVAFGGAISAFASRIAPKPDAGAAQPPAQPQS